MKRFSLLLSALAIGGWNLANPVQDGFVMIACEHGTTLKAIQEEYDELGGVTFAKENYAFIYDKNTGKPYMWSQYDEALILFTGKRKSDKALKIEYESKLSKDGKTIIGRTSETWIGSKPDAPNGVRATSLEYYDLNKKTQTIKEEGEKDVVNKCLFFDLPREVDVILDKEED